MPLSAERDLIRRDTDLPGLARLLVPDVLLAQLQRSLPDAGIRSARLRYLRYKPTQSCLAAYSIDIAGQSVEAYAKAFRREDLLRLNKARERHKVIGVFGTAGVIWPEAAVQVSFFPNDARLHSLGRVANSEHRRQLLKRVVPERLDLGDSDLRPLNYKPERRFVGCLSRGEKSLAALKAYTDSEFESVHLRARALAKCGFPCPARFLGHSTRRRVLLFEWMPGENLRDLSAIESFAMHRLRDVGAALATLHGTRRVRLPHLARTVEAASLPPLAEAIGWTLPHLLERARQLATRISNHFSECPEQWVPVHGDFYDKQVLLSADGVTFLDFDEAALGDPAMDLGNFLASFEKQVLLGRLTPTRAAALQRELLAGYSAARPLPPAEHLDFYIAAALLARTPHYFRCREPNWPTLTEMAMERIACLLDSSLRSRNRVAPPAKQASTEILSGSQRAVPGRSARVGLSLCVKPSMGDLVQNQKRGGNSTEDELRKLAMNDPAMPFLRDALIPSQAEPRLQALCRIPDSTSKSLRLRELTLRRYKPQRRCLIEYAVDLISSTGEAESVVWLGKARARGLRPDAIRLLNVLRAVGFVEGSAQGVFVPAPVGVIPEFQMWLQCGVDGQTVTSLLAGPCGMEAVQRAAEALHQLHLARVPARRRHTLADELMILGDRLTRAVELRPDLRDGIENVLADCERLASSFPSDTTCGIHRDFYPDQVLISGNQACLLDLDLYAEGDPALDAGNFIGHVTEFSLRRFGQPDALADREDAFLDRYLELSGERQRAAVQAYATLTLARQIFLSTQFPDRQRLTESLVELCRARLECARRTIVATATI